jgi:hypothetical protein
MPLDVTTHQEALPYSPFTTTTKGFSENRRVNFYPTIELSNYENNFLQLRERFLTNWCLMPFPTCDKLTPILIEMQIFFNHSTKKNVSLLLSED